MEKDYVAVGRIKRAVGLKGEVLIKAFSSTKSIIVPGCLFLKEKDGFRRFQIARFRKKGPKELVCLLEGVNNRTLAEGLERRQVFQEKSLLPREDTDEYFWYELEGLRVMDQDGKELGTVYSIIEAGAQDVLVVRDGKREILIPMVDEFIKEIDTTRGICLVDLPPGLEETTATSIKGKRK